MADTVTPNYALTKPEISGSPFTWGNKLNSNFDKIDTGLKGAKDRADSAILRSGAEKFAAPVAYEEGVVPTAFQHMATKGYVDTSVTDGINAVLPIGSVVMWYGDINNIPVKWRLCDGGIYNGMQVPDLRTKFVMGAGIGAGFYPIGGLGGAWTHNHSGSVGATTLNINQIPSHSHSYSDPGHGHGVFDPGHVHSYLQPNPTQGSSTVGSGITGWTGAFSQPTTTGAFTGIAIQGNVTGITINANGGSQAHTHTIPDAVSAPPFMALAFIIKVFN